jgi:hypothetical protein
MVTKYEHFDDVRAFEQIQVPRDPGPLARLRYASPAELTPRERDRLWFFFRRFVRRDRDAFEAKLLTCDEVFLGTGADGELVAFGAVDVLETTVCGVRQGVLMTRWAALDPSARGQNVIQRVGLRCFLRFRARHPLTPAYWMFGASTFKSYLLLARNCGRFWPRRDVAWPERELAIVRDVMARQSDGGWDPEHGVVRRFGVSRYAEGVIDDEPAALRDPDVRFYREKNPGQVDGDTLLCICPLDAANWLSIAGAAWSRAKARGPSRWGRSSSPNPFTMGTLEGASASGPRSLRSPNPFRDSPAPRGLEAPSDPRPTRARTRARGHARAPR